MVVDPMRLQASAGGGGFGMALGISSGGGSDAAAGSHGGGVGSTTTAAGSLFPLCTGPPDPERIWLGRLYHGGLPPTLHHDGIPPISLVCRSTRSKSDPARRVPRSDGSDGSKLGWARQRARLGFVRVFFYFLID